MFIPRKFYNIRRDNPGSSMMQTEKLSAIGDEYADNYVRLQKDRDLYSRFAPYLFKRKVYIYMFILSKVNVAGQCEMMRRFSEEMREAVAKHEYKPHMFTRSIQSFLGDVYDWREGDPIPVYSRRRSFVGRLLECIQEHGGVYTVRRILFKAGLKAGDFLANLCS